jgi:hypothetical protein
MSLQSDNCAVTQGLVDLGFAHSHEVEINPEFPPAGDWGCPTFAFGARGEDSLTIKVRPWQGGSWVASFALETRGFLNGVYACPNPGQLVVFAGWTALLMQAADPANTHELPMQPVRSAVRPLGTDLLVVGSFIDAAALDSNGLRWVTGRLFLDDLEFVAGLPGTVTVQGRRGYESDDLMVLTLDPVSGRVIGGN